MTQRRTQFQIADIARADFRTSFIADAENTRIQKALQFPYRYQPARLAISLSLKQPQAPKPIQDGGGRPIKGDILFGQDEADLTLWIVVIMEHVGEMTLTRREFQDLVAAHWARGMEELSRNIGSASSIENAFTQLLAAAPSR